MMNRWLLLVLGLLLPLALAGCPPVTTDDDDDATPRRVSDYGPFFMGSCYGLDK